MWKKITANTFYQLAGKGFRVAASVAVVALITRALGTAGFGDYVLATTVPAFLFLFVDFGLNAIFLREVSQDEKHMEKFGSLFVLRLGLSVLFFLLGVGYVLVSPYSDLVKTAIILALTAVFAQGFFTSLNALFQHNLRYDLSVLAGVLSSTLGVALVVWGFLRRSGLLFFIGAWVLSAFTLAVLAFLLSKKLAGKFGLSFDRIFLRRLFFAALPLGLMLVFAQISAKVDVFLLSLLDTPQSVGIYGLADKVFESILVVPIFFVNALYPVMLRDRKRNLSVLWTRLKKGVFILLAVSLVLALGGFVLAPLVILVLGGEGFSSSILVLRLLALILPFFFVTAPLQWFLITVGKEKVLPIIYAAAAVVNVAINVLFIPRFSYLAAVSAVAFSEILILVLLLVTVGSFRGRMTIQPRK